MNNKNLDIYKAELEDITGKIFEGDFTPLVYDLLKNTPDRSGLIRYLGGKPRKKETVKSQKQKPAVSFDDLFSAGTEVR